MHSNLSVNKSNPSFGLNVSNKFIKAAHNYYNGVEYRPWRAKIFDKRVKEVVETFGYEDFELVYKKTNLNNNHSHALYAVKDGMEPVLITKKDQLRKVIEKFRFMNRHEIYMKIHNAQVEQGLK